jgi:translation initiation factor 6 (eIF-6)
MEIMLLAPSVSQNENDGGFLLREALREAQEQAIINGTSELTLDEINEIITAVRNDIYCGRCM